jgi:hypothetical protein
MTTAVATASTALNYPHFSWGPVKVQIMDMPIISGDTVATATATRLSRVDYAILIAGVVQTAVPTYATNVATFAFTDPAATCKGQVLLFGG